MASAVAAGYASLDGYAALIQACHTGMSTNPEVGHAFVVAEG